MGGFYLVTASEPMERRQALSAVMDRSFLRQGLLPAQRIECRGHLLQTFRKRGKSGGGDVSRDPADPEWFVAACGTLVVDGKTGPDALNHLLTRAAPDNDATNLLGSYCLVIGDRHGLHLRCDPLGLQLVFRNDAGTVWSSSFLALAGAVSATRFRPQALFEYVFMEMPHGGDTIVDGVMLHDCRQIAHFEPGLRLETVIAPLPEVDATRGLDDLTEDCVATLRTSFKSIADAFSGRIDSGLSGGYDSRLILASLLAVHARPRLHVYGDGASADVFIANQLAATAGLGIHHRDKGKPVYPSREEYRAKAVEWLYAFDGYPADGVMGNGQDLETRLQRVADDSVALNGGGGEIFRNFFYLPDRSYTRRELLWTFYSQFDPATMRNDFTPEDYYRQLENKLSNCVGHRNTTLVRREIEWIYTAFRCRFWMARNNSVNNRFGAYLTPLFTWPLAKLSLAIPMQERNHGRFEAGLIRALAPTLAAVTTTYGHDCRGEIPWRRMVKDGLTLARPPWARRWSFAIQARLRSPPPPAWHAVAAESLSADLPRMNRYFDVARIRHHGQLNRLYTLELLAEELQLS